MKSMVVAFLAIYASVAVAAETGLLGVETQTIIVAEQLPDKTGEVSDTNKTAIDEEEVTDKSVNIAPSAMPNPCSLAVVDCDNQVSVAVMIREVFGPDADNAVKIAKCESGFEPARIGDKNLTLKSVETGEIVGDSIGIFQIRTGGEGWNRAARNGMSADRFRAWMSNPRENVKYAKQIFDRRGWEAWHNCATRVGAYK